jgi:hypothetical protein
MSEIYFIIKCIVYAVFFIFLSFFITYFILANDHVVTVYINPIYFSPEFYGGSPEFVLAVWQLVFIAFSFGCLVMGIFLKFSMMKQNSIIDSLTKQNSGLKGKFDKVKTDISKCVS